MVIEESDFRVTSNSGHFWDLELLYTIRPKGGTEREEFKDAGYGMPLTTCIQRVIAHRLARKQEVYNLKEYVKAYKEQVSIIDLLLKDM